MKRRVSPRGALGALGVLGALALAGCGGPRRSAAPAPGAPPAGEPPRAVAPDPRREVTAERAGPVALGMAAEEVKRLPELTVLETQRELEGSPAPSLTINQFGMPIALAELKEGRVWRIQVLSERLATPQGARVGMTAGELEGVYGPGEVLSGEGNVCAAFPSAPGLSFCFRRDPPLPANATWETLRAKEPVVERILIVGRPPAG